MLNSHNNMVSVITWRYGEKNGKMELEKNSNREEGGAEERCNLGVLD